ncbi:MAG: peptide deformylase [Deltaproteobacteria bacterium]|nr:MAG: peptide deformylase [Deltaproteobacteria bacterium]
MALLDIITFPNPMLAGPSELIHPDEINDDLQKLIEDMADTLYEAPGVGLAAVQVGIPRSLVLIDPEPDPVARNFTVLINPEIVSQDGSFLSEQEGCLSVPDYRADVNRYDSVVVEALDRNGVPIRIEAEGFEAVVFQHEIDHTRGILFIDRISKLKRQLYRRKRMKQLKSKR